jgi:hypothetical protein
MITALVLLTTLLPMQDTPAGKDPAVPPATPPAAAPGDKAAAPAPAIPAETPEAVKKFLKDAEAHFYDPQAAGLSAMEFDVPVEMPQVGVIGNEHVSWTAGGTETITLDRTGGKDLPPGLPVEMIENYGKQIGMQMLGTMLNKLITPMLEDSVATMDGVEDGLVKVSFHNAQATAAGLQEQSLFFDDSGVLQRMRTVRDQESGMGKVTIKQVQNFTWKPVKDGSTLLICPSQKGKAEMGMMGIDIDMQISFETVGEIVLATQISTTQNVPMRGPINQVLKATNLKVNGQAPAPKGG